MRLSQYAKRMATADGEASFTPEIVDEILITVRDLLESARRGRRTVLTEYILSVGENVVSQTKINVMPQ